ncbi:hypothetical protein MPH_07008 [Macrophomina phaseolina MS6]|uniref:Uncharacterized protein n=1 Tax=Macrophomina phaseolina (strain MS6) TaxID=1126212 RepID=K2SG46_MACPH|nr:hypothetical protein MPH_07008 [Macrophomina phaseolina MS6]
MSVCSHLQLKGVEVQVVKTAMSHGDDGAEGPLSRQAKCGKESLIVGSGIAELRHFGHRQPQIIKVSERGPLRPHYRITTVAQPHARDGLRGQGRPIAHSLFSSCTRSCVGGLLLLPAGGLHCAIDYSRNARASGYSRLWG